MAYSVNQSAVVRECKNDVRAVPIRGAWRGTGDSVWFDIARNAMGGYLHGHLSTINRSRKAQRRDADRESRGSDSDFHEAANLYIEGVIPSLQADDLSGGHAVLLPLVPRVRRENRIARILLPMQAVGACRIGDAGTAASEMQEFLKLKAKGDNLNHVFNDLPVRPPGTRIKRAAKPPPSKQEASSNRYALACEPAPCQKCDWIASILKSGGHKNDYSD